MIALEALRKSDLFGGLSDDELLAVARIAREETCEAGTQIFAENEVARTVYVVREGRVAILVGVGLERQAVMSVVTKGGSFGWSALVAPYIRATTAKAVEKSRVVTIASEALHELRQGKCCAYYTVIERVAALAFNRLKETRLQLINLMYN